MLVRSITKLIAVSVLALGTCTLLAQDGPPYPPDYPFGANGNEGHPNGYDGWPGDHPDNPSSPHGGPGGNGIGSGNGGHGGAGASPSGHGGTGGNSGPDGGAGGDGGDGGTNPNDEGIGGNGGTGGVGVDTGGNGGDGGEGEHGGNGGNGGNATGDNSTGGEGGDGGTATDGVGGKGGEGGDSVGVGGCGGDGGRGGDAETGGLGGDGGRVAPGRGGVPGSGGAPDNPCGGEWGENGEYKRLLQAWLGIMPSRIASAPADLPVVPGDPELEKKLVARMLNGWTGYAGPNIRLGALKFPYRAEPTPEELFTFDLILHPESLLGDTVRVVIEYRAFGDEPELHISFGVDGEIASIQSLPIPLEDGWMRRSYTVVRQVAGEPLGKHLDMLRYSVRNMEVRLFQVVDLGKKGDVNNDAVVDAQDLIVVTGNYAQQGDLDIEDGDTNLDGVVDTADVLNVINGIE